MALEIISDPPATDSFTPLTSHQSQTPESFFGAKPVLHYEDKRAKVVTSKNQLDRLPVFSDSSSDHTKTSNGAADTADDANGHAAGTEDVLISDIGIWVTSELVVSSFPCAIYISLQSLIHFPRGPTRRFILYNFSNSTGVSIPYPSILLHAIQRRHIPGASSSSDTTTQEEQGIYMQVAKSISSSDNNNNPNTEDEYDDDGAEEEEDMIDLTIFPSTTAQDAVESRAETTSNQSPIQRFFTAISTCSNLHPDPSGMNDATDGLDNDGDDDDPIVFEGSVGYTSSLMPSGDSSTLPPPLPGSSGWITAENVGEYFDEEGNWRGHERSLGPGAGTVRTRDTAAVEAGQEQENGKDEHDDDDDVVEETKWRRTG